MADKLLASSWYVLLLYKTVAEFSAAKVRKLDVVTEKCVQHLNSEENGKGKNVSQFLKNKNIILNLFTDF